jgi:hypothetical protein
MFKKQVASKEQVKLMIALTGPSGSGKTYSALQLAYGITGDWSKIAVADTENRSALYYAGERTGKWEHIDFAPSMLGGYHPNNWIKLIEFAESDPNTSVLILDSITHEWQGKGGCLELVDAYSKNQKGNTFTPWKTVTPLHTSFIDRMRSSRLHIIATMRSKTEYAQERNEHGKMTPKKLGLGTMQREGTDYEFGVIFDIEIESHSATSSKDRTGLFAGKPPFLITPEIGKQLLVWANEGEKTEHSPQELEIFDPEKHADRVVKYIKAKHPTWTDSNVYEATKMMDGKAMTKLVMDNILEEFKAKQNSEIFAG